MPDAWTPSPSSSSLPCGAWSCRNRRSPEAQLLSCVTTPGSWWLLLVGLARAYPVAAPSPPLAAVVWSARPGPEDPTSPLNCLTSEKSGGWCWYPADLRLRARSSVAICLALAATAAMPGRAVLLLPPLASASAAAAAEATEAAAADAMLAGTACTTVAGLLPSPASAAARPVLGREVGVMASTSGGIGRVSPTLLSSRVAAVKVREMDCAGAPTDTDAPLSEGAGAAAAACASAAVVAVVTAPTVAIVSAASVRARAASAPLLALPAAADPGPAVMPPGPVPAALALPGLLLRGVVLPGV